MIKIEIDDAPARLHDMWDAVLADKTVHFTRSGVTILHIVSTGLGVDRTALLEELREEINYHPKGP